MKIHHLAVLSLRVVGILLLLQVLQQTPMYLIGINQLSHADLLSQQAYWVSLGVQTLYLIFVVTMIAAPSRLSLWLGLRNMEGKTDNLTQNIDSNTLQVGAFVAIGVYTLSWSIPELCQLLLNPVFMPPHTTSHNFARIAHSIRPLAGVAIGLYLTISARGFQRILSSLRGR